MVKPNMDTIIANTYKFLVDGKEMPITKHSVILPVIKNPIPTFRFVRLRLADKWTQPRIYVKYINQMFPSDKSLQLDKLLLENCEAGSYEHRSTMWNTDWCGTEGPDYDGYVEFTRDEDATLFYMRFK